MSGKILVEVSRRERLAKSLASLAASVGSVAGICYVLIAQESPFGAAALVPSAIVGASGVWHYWSTRYVAQPTPKEVAQVAAVKAVADAKQVEADRMSPTALFEPPKIGLIEPLTDPG